MAAGQVQSHFLAVGGGVEFEHPVPAGHHAVAVTQFAEDEHGEQDASSEQKQRLDGICQDNGPEPSDNGVNGGDDRQQRDEGQVPGRVDFDFWLLGQRGLGHLSGLDGLEVANGL